MYILQQKFKNVLLAILIIKNLKTIKHVLYAKHQQILNITTKVKIAVIIKHLLIVKHNQKLDTVIHVILEIHSLFIKMQRLHKSFDVF